MSPWTLFVILAAGIAAYSNSFTGAFLFDDRRFILSSVLQSVGDVPRIRPLAEILTGPRPFLHLTFSLNHALGGLNPWGYHVVNLAIHLLAGLTLFGIVRRTLLSPRLKPRYGEKAQGLALTISLLWLLHPLQTQSVTYLIQRAESLMGLFYLLTLYGVIRGWKGRAILACSLGMATKEVMMTAPLVILLYDRVFLSSSFKEIFQKRKFLYLGLFATGILVARQILWIFHPSEMNHRTVGFGVPNLTPFNYALTQPGVILHYLKLSLFPHPLVIDYQWAVARSWEAVLIPGLIIGALLCFTLLSFRKRPELGFLGAWFFLILAPTSSFIPIVDLAFEHRMYLPLASVITSAVLLGYPLLQNQPFLAKGLVFFLTATLGTLTFLRNQDYQSEVRIWQDTVEKRPGNWRAFNNLGKALENEGRLEAAAQALTRALALAPNYVEAHNNLGNVLTAQGKVEEAIFHYQEALRIYPHFAKAHYNLGNALAKQGKLGEALPHYAEAVRINPLYDKARYNLATVLAKEGRLEEAIHHYTELLRLKPDYPDAQKNLFIIQEDESNRLAKNEAPLA